MHITLEGIFRDAVQRLPVANRPQRYQVHHLRLAAGKDCAAVRSGHDARFAPNGADVLIASAIRADAVVGDFLADDLLHNRIKAVMNIRLAIRIFLCETLHSLLLDLLFAGFALGAAGGIHRPNHAVVELFAHGRIQLFGNVIELIFLLGLADIRLNAFDEGTDFLDFLMRQQNCLQHLCLADLVRPCLNHHDGIFGAGESQMHAALCALLAAWVDDELPVHITDDNRARRPHEGKPGNGKRNRGADHTKDFRRHIRIHGEHRNDHLNVVIIALGEERPQRPVDQAAGQNCLFRGAPLPLDESPGDFAYSIHFLFKLDAEREEIHAVSRVFRSRRVDEDNRIPAAHNAGAICLRAVFAGFDNELSATQLHLIHMIFLHVTSSQAPACLFIFHFNWIQFHVPGSSGGANTLHLKG